MGYGGYSHNVRATRTSTKAAAGIPTFQHTAAVQSGAVRAGAHEDLDPKRLNKNGPFAGKNTREAADSDDHPNALPIFVALDVTDSNYSAAIAAHKKLPDLNGLLQRKGYVEDPQLLFAAVGDAHTDAAPIQVSQFESDNRMDEHIENIYLEGGGGGQVHESYELMAYFALHGTHLDSFEKRGVKGFLFFIGDEMPYEVVKKDQIRNVLGLDAEADVPTKEVFEALKEKFEVFFLFQLQGAYPESRVVPAWRELLGERALILENPDAVAETIGLTIGLVSGATTLEDGLDDLKDAGFDPHGIQAAGKALATVGGNATVAAKTTGELDLGDEGGTAERL